MEDRRAQAVKTDPQRGCSPRCQLQDGGLPEVQCAGAKSAVSAGFAGWSSLCSGLKRGRWAVWGRHGHAGGLGSGWLRRLRWQRDSRGLGGAGTPEPLRRGGRLPPLTIIPSGSVWGRM